MKQEEVTHEITVLVNSSSNSQNYLIHVQGVGKLKKNPEELGRIVKNHLVFDNCYYIFVFNRYFVI